MHIKSVPGASSALAGRTEEGGMLGDRRGMNFREAPWQGQNGIDYPGRLVITYFKSITYISERPHYYAIEIAKIIARRFLKHPQITPQQVIGLGNALYALERIPIITPGSSSEFGLEYRTGTVKFSEMRYINFRVSESEFEISKGGSVYDEAVGSDSISEAEWLIEVGGYRNTECELYDLEDSVEEYLNLGVEITVHDESEIEYE